MNEIDELKNMIRELLWNSVPTGLGGYRTQFGPVLMGKMLKATNYDLSKRAIFGFHVDGTKMKQHSHSMEWKNLRHRFNLSLREASKETGVSAATISRLERGKNVLWSTIGKLARYYNERRTKEEIEK